MSYKALNWAWEADLPTSQKFVLVALADMADEHESCFPGQERLGRMIGATDRTVRAALVKLEDAGYISRKQRRGTDGMRTSDRYTLLINRKNLPLVAESPETDVDLTGNLRRPHRKQLPGNPQRTTREPSVLLSSDKSVDHGDLISDSWMPNIKHRDLAEALNLDLDMQLSKFVAHAHRTRRRLKNWNSGFTNWLKQAAVYAQQKSGQPAMQTFARQKQNNTLALVAQYREEERLEEVGDRAIAGL